MPGAGPAAGEIGQLCRALRTVGEKAWGLSSDEGEVRVCRQPCPDRERGKRRSRLAPGLYLQGSLQSISRADCALELQKPPSMGCAELMFLW